MNKNAQVWKCEFCGQSLIGRKAFFQHNRVCEERLKEPHDSLGRIIKPEQSHHKNKCYTPHKHSEESKKKISAGRLKALAEGRGNHWICPHINRSYAEQYFYDCFTNSKIEFQNNIWLCGRYCVDFLFKNKYFEVDGEQHFTKQGIEHDKEREKFLAERGYICVGRCRWSSFKKLTEGDKQKYIQEIICKL